MRQAMCVVGVSAAVALSGCTGLGWLGDSSSTVFVAPDGSDVNPGTRAKPFATLDRARRAIRSRLQDEKVPAGGLTVWLREGEYALTETFALGPADSGVPGAPVTYRAYRHERVRIHGGVPIPATAFEPVPDHARTAPRLDPEARDHVLRANLSTLGIGNLGQIPELFRGAPSVPELFCNDQRMTLARWPNEGWAEIAKVVERGSVPRRGDTSGKPGVFEYAGDRPARWDVEHGVWLHGYYCFDWYSETIKVQSIDPRRRTILFERPHHYGLGGGNPGPRRYQAINVLEELDEPGEYYIDRRSGMLYFWPPEPIGQCRVVLSVLETPLISLEDARHVVLQGLTFETCRGDALVVTGGCCVTVAACEVRNTGHGGIRLSEGRGHKVVGCDIHHTGTGGLYVSGGDRKKLEPAGHEALNNHIYAIARRQRTHAYAIHISGVGNRIAHCLLHDIPHQAIGLSGNDHLIEYNVVHHSGMETDDCGAFYMGRDPSMRGNVLRYNFWHHIGAPMSHGNNAIYFDDGAGGSTVFGNVLFRCGNPGRGRMGAVFCHGGHQNHVENNVFVECQRAIGASPWNNKRWQDFLKQYRSRLVEDVDIRKPPYVTRYPELNGYLEPTDEPRMNTAVRNVAVWCGDFICGNYSEKDNFITDEDPGFADAPGGNFALRKDSIVFDKIPGFQPIPFAKMGLYTDALRPRLPDDPWKYPPPEPLPPLTTQRPAVKATAAPQGASPVFRVPHRQTTVTIDGEIAPGEWDGATPDQAMKLAQDVQGHPSHQISLAWLAHDGRHLFVAIDNAVDPWTPLQTGQQWGLDAVELAFQNPVLGPKAPIIVLRGYPAGQWESSGESGAPSDVVQKAAEGVQYAARIHGKRRWTAEWGIPLASLGIDPAQHKKLAFNITVRKTAHNLWLMWEGTRAHSWRADKAGFIVLDP